MGATAAVTGIVGAAGIGASLYGSSKQASAAKDAAQTQAASADRSAEMQLRAAREANALQREILDWQKSMYGQTQQTLAPWVNAGGNASYNALIGLAPGGEYDLSGLTYKGVDMSDWQADPGYQWAKQEGLNSLLAASAAAGNYGSGNMGKDLMAYGMNAANQMYTDVYGRREREGLNIFNSKYQSTLAELNALLGISSLGENAAAQTGNAGISVGNAMGNNANAMANSLQYGTTGATNALMSGATALAAGTNTAGRAWADTGYNVGNILNNILSTYQNNQWQEQLLNALSSRSTAGGGSVNSFAPSWDTSRITYDPNQFQPNAFNYS